MKIVSENRFSGKTYFITITSRFNERTIVPMDTTELGLTEFLDFLER